MAKFIWSRDKEMGRWPEEIKAKMVDPTLLPRHFNSEDKLEYQCEMHGVFSSTISSIYRKLNNYGELLCTKCSRLVAQERTEKTNMAKYGTKAPAQNKDVLNRMKETNLERYGVEFQVQARDFEEKRKITNLERYGEEYAILNKEVKAKANETMFEKYGTIHALQNEDSHNKFKDTMNERYGVDYALQNEELRGRFSESMLDKYGAQHALQNEDSKLKMRETNIERFGTEYASQNPDIQEKMNSTFMDKYGTHPLKTYEIYLKTSKSKGVTPVTREIYEMFSNKEAFSAFLDRTAIEFGEKPALFQLEKLTGYSTTGIYKRVVEFDLLDKIRFLSGESQYEYEIMEFLDNYEIKNHHCYTKLGPELDVYIEKYDIGIEFNGLYWHSEQFKKPKDHYKKFKHYNELGTRLLNIYEDEWKDEDKQAILKSTILRMCDIEFTKNYFLKDLTLEIIEGPVNDNLIHFYDENDLEGYDPNTDIHIVLVNNEGVIIQAMSFTTNDKIMNLYLIKRNCIRKYNDVIRGTNELLQSFIKTYYHGKSMLPHIAVNCDLDKNDGKEYEIFGFQLTQHRNQMWTVNGDYRTRIENMPSDDSIKIYGCGIVTYVYNPKKKKKI